MPCEGRLQKGPATLKPKGHGTFAAMLEVTQATQPRPLPDMTRDERRDLGLFRLLRVLPVALVSRIGASLGQRLGRRGHPAAAARVKAALRHLLPDIALDPHQLEDAQRRLWANVGRVYAEFCVLDRIVSEGRVSIRDDIAMDAVLADGRPVIIAYAHLGNWEAVGMHLSRGLPDRMCAFAIAPANRVQVQIAAMQRARFPGKVVAVDGMAWRHALEHLQQPGGIMYISVDENNDDGVPIPSFGRALDQRDNLGKIVRMAARTGAIILPSYCERLPGARFCVHFLEPMEFVPCRAIDPQETMRRMQHLDALFAPVVLRLIDQWFGLLEFRP
jgi:Kdo2-lipid IVA lauroyltransferase/acyltransferase